MTPLAAARHKGPAQAKPPASSARVSAQMSRMPRKNSTPELALRQALHRRGLRYRLHAPLPGKPDVVFSARKLAVFVDGCFWHACPMHGSVPKNNRQWWQEKLAATVLRDRRKDAALAALGWATIHVWEHERPEEAAERVVVALRTRSTGIAQLGDFSGSP
jgi:DNA mismatch endonuclease, patch repair protein